MELSDFSLDNRDATYKAITGAMQGLPTWDEVDAAAPAARNPFYTPTAIW